jgi:hypothetical protein
MARDLQNARAAERPNNLLPHVTYNHDDAIVEELLDYGLSCSPIGVLVGLDLAIGYGR